MSGVGPRGQNLCLQFQPHGGQAGFSPSRCFFSSTYTVRRSLSMNIKICPAGYFLPVSFQQASSNLFSPKTPATGWPYKLRSNGIIGPSMLSQCFEQRFRGSLIRLRKLTQSGGMTHLDLSMRKQHLLLPVTCPATGKKCPVLLAAVMCGKHPCVVFYVLPHCPWYFCRCSASSECFRRQRPIRGAM